MSGDKPDLSTSPVAIDEQLFQLLLEASLTYQTEVIQHNKLFHRYAEDFINMHTYIDATDAASKNLHNRNLHIIKNLFRDNEPLVREYFNSSFSLSAATSLMNTFDTIAAVTYDKTGQTSQALPDFGYTFNTRQLRIIHHFAKEYHIFKITPSLQDIKDLFTCKLQEPLQAANNGHVALMFSELYKAHTIGHNWQYIIESRRLIYSSKSLKPLSSNALSSGLSQSRHLKRDIEKYEELIKALHKMGQDVKAARQSATCNKQ